MCCNIIFGRNLSPHCSSVGKLGGGAIQDLSTVFHTYIKNICVVGFLYLFFT